jgi:hypothetical protein
VWDDVLELLVEDAKNVVEEVTVLNARAEIAESVPMCFILEVYSTTERLPWLNP